MAYRIKQINNIEVKKVKTKQSKDHRPIRGSEICNELYSQIFLVAKTNTGKSTVIYNMLKRFVDKNTKIVIFCSTVFQDPIWESIREFCFDKNLDCDEYTSLIEDNVNVLDFLMGEISAEMKEKEEDEKSKETDPDERFSKNLNSYLKDYLFDDEEEEVKERKPRYQAPDYIFIFDDISSELKNNAISSLMKKFRHYHCKVIISSQDPYDLQPQSRKQIYLWLIFKGEVYEKLIKIHRDSDCSLSFEQFYEMYMIATEGQHDFFYCDVRKNDYRINFNKKFLI